MYTTIIHPIRKAYNLSMNEYAVLDTIYHLSNNIKYGGWCIMSKDNIANSLDLSRQTVSKIINTLLEKELIEKDVKTSHIRTLDEWNNVIANKDDWLIASKGENSIMSAKVTQCKESLQSGVKKVYTECKESLHNNNKDNNKDNNKEKSFEIFWNKYDKKIDRKKTQTKWNNLTKQNRKKAIEAVDGYVKSTPEIKFRKHPVTWLNGECWENEVLISDDFYEKEASRLNDMEFLQKYGDDKYKQFKF